MSYLITNQRNDGQFQSDDGESILDAALRDNRIYPYGCRNGACGACKCTLVSGEVDYGNYEDFALTDEDKADGKLLICQAIPLSDVVIDVDEVMGGADIRIKMLPCRVGKLEKLADDVVRMYLNLPKSQEFNYIDGHFTPRVFDSMKERDLLRMEGPFGTYFMQTEVERPIIMVAGGTGFSPVKGLIDQAMATDPNYQIHLFWGARDEQDLYLDGLVREWQSQYPNFTYTPVLSDSSSDSWAGATGWVHQEVEKHFEDVSNHDVYASGPPVMIDAVRNALLPRGMDTANFFFDSFDYAPQS